MNPINPILLICEPFINLVETTTPLTLYHGTKNRFDLDNEIVLEPRRTGYVNGTGLDAFDRQIHIKCEALLEKYRPAGAIPRSRAVFMMDIPDGDTIEKAGGYANYIYSVQPIGAVWRCNLHWYSELYSLCHDDEINEDEAANFAHKYWSAAASERDLFEYLARSATVIKLVQSYY